MQERLRSSFKQLLQDRASLVLAAILALLCPLGYAVDTCIIDSDFTKFAEYYGSHFLYVIPLFALFALGIHLLFSSLDRSKPKDEPKAELPWYVTFAIILAVWGVGIVACWPGNVGWDFTDQLLQTMGQVELSNHHPFLTTQIFGAIYQFGREIWGSSTGGIATLYVTQFLFCASIFTWALHWFARMGAPTWLQRACLGYYALCPQVALYVTVLTKDVPSSAAVAFATTQAVMHLWASIHKVKMPVVAQWPALAAGMLACSLLRHNNVYQLLPQLLALIICETKKQRVFALSMVLSSAALLFLWNSVVLPSMHVKPGNSREALCLPLQQVALVCKERGNELTYDEQTTIMRYWNMPYDWLAGYFDYHTGDNAKAFFNINNELPLGDFFALWAKLGMRYPGIYLREALANSVGYWYPGVASYTWKEYILFNVTKYDPQGTFEAMDGYIYDFYGPAAQLKQVTVANAELRDGFSTAVDAFVEAPVFKYLYRPATYVWINLLLGIWAALRRNKAWCLLASNVMLFAVCCASPLHIAMRYVLPVVFTLPVNLTACVVLKEREQHERPEG